jgi:hypothetical protein
MLFWITDAETRYWQAFHIFLSKTGRCVIKGCIFVYHLSGLMLSTTGSRPSKLKNNMNSLKIPATWLQERTINYEVDIVFEIPLSGDSISHCCTC